MEYYKLTANGYILGVGIGVSGIAIEESEYTEIMNAISSKPAPTETTDYQLKEDLTWEAYEIEPMPDPEPTDEDYAIAGRILMGVES